MGDENNEDVDDWPYRPAPLQPWEQSDGWRSVYDLSDDAVVAEMSLLDAVRVFNTYDQVFASREFNGGDLLVVHGDPDPYTVTLIGDGLARWAQAGLDERRRLMSTGAAGRSSWLYGDLSLSLDPEDPWPVAVCLSLLEQADGSPRSPEAITFKALLEMPDELPQFQDPALRTLLALTDAPTLLRRVRFRPGPGHPVDEDSVGALFVPAWAQRGAADVADGCDGLDEQAVQGRFTPAVRFAWVGWEAVAATSTGNHSLALFHHQADGRWAAVAQPLGNAAWRSLSANERRALLRLGATTAWVGVDLVALYRRITDEYQRHYGPETHDSKHFALWWDLLLSLRGTTAWQPVADAIASGNVPDTY